MYLIIDMGNSSVTCGLSKSESAGFKTWRFATELIKHESKLKSFILRELKKQSVAKGMICSAVICSVVPKMEKLLAKQLAKILPNAQIQIFGIDIPISIENKYKIPEEVGKDRLANGIGAQHYYTLPVIIVDFGTAITVDVITKDGKYLGGAITPGISISCKALYEQTALLPLVESRRPKTVVGKSTEDSVLSGVFFGYGGMVDSLITGIKKELKIKPYVIGTGGNLTLIKDFCHKIDKFDPLLTLKGIKKAYFLK